MKVVGTYEIPAMPKDERWYTAKCPDLKCRRILEFQGWEIKYITPEPTYHIGEFNKRISHQSESYYAVICPCGHKIDLGNTEYKVFDHLISKREKEKAQKKYENEHPTEFVTYD